MKKIIYTTLVALMTGLTGCSDFLKDASQDLVIVKNPSDVNEVLLGSGYLPTKEMKYIGSSAFAPFLNYMDDDVEICLDEKDQCNDHTLKPFLYGYYCWQFEVARSHDKSTVGYDNQTWDGLYARINVMNVILDELNKMKINKEEDKVLAERVTGETKFLRAVFYFYLTNLYGNAYAPSTASSTLGVPLKLTHYVEYDKDKKVQFERATLDKLYAQIVIDLKDAIVHFTNSPQTKKLYRANKGAAQLMLSRVYLYMQDWKNAKLAATDFLAEHSALSSLLGSSEMPFISEDSPEVIFSQGSLVCENNLYGKGGDFCITPDLYNLYDKENDGRYERFFTTSALTDSIAVGNKYKRSLHISYVSDIFTLRTAEGFLNLAEAEAMLGEDGAAAGTLERLLKTRIRDYVATSATGEDLVNEIRTERRKELCIEGHRWFDLRRYAVNEKYPYSKDINHTWGVFDGSKLYFKSGEVYSLPAGDLAYTMQIPKSVTDLEPEFVANDREERKYVSNFTSLDKDEEGGDEETGEN